MMNSGAPITGMDRRPLNKAGMDICGRSFSVIPAGGRRCAKDARHHTKKAIAPRARARSLLNVNVAAYAAMLRRDRRTHDRTSSFRDRTSPNYWQSAEVT